METSIYHDTAAKTNKKVSNGMQGFCWEADLANKW